MLHLVPVAGTRASFPSSVFRSPTEMICSASSFICSWADLHKGNAKEMLEAGAEALKQAALDFHLQGEETIAECCYPANGVKRGGGVDARSCSYVWPL